MTDKEKQQIRQLRMQGVGYRKIASEQWIGINTVKSFCQANQLTGKRSKEPLRKNCRQCGKPISSEGKPPRSRQFCSEECRKRYWNRHHERKEPVLSVCPVCGKTITSFPSQPRKYCSCARIFRFLQKFPFRPAKAGLFFRLYLRRKKP